MFTPEHLHVALNHVALIGFAVAVIPLLIGLIRKDCGALLSGLLIVLICGLSIPVVMETGDGECRAVDFHGLIARRNF